MEYTMACRVVVALVGVLVSNWHTPTVQAFQEAQSAAVNQLPAGCIGQLGKSRFRANRQVLRIALSPDGTRVIIVGKEGTAGLWDVQSGRLIRAVESGDSNNTATIRRIPAWSHDGSRVAITNSQGEVRMIDGSTGALLDWQPQLPPDEWDSVKNRLTLAIFSPDDTQLVAGYAGGMVAVLDAEDGRLQRTHRCLSTPLAAAFQDDAKQVIIFQQRKTAVEIDWPSGQMSTASRYIPDLRAGSRFDFATSGRLFAIDRNQVHMYLPGVPRPQGAFRGRAGRMTAIGVSGNGQIVAATDPRGTVFLLNAVDLSEIASFESGMTGYLTISHVSLSHDGSVVALAPLAGGSRVRLWKRPAAGAAPVEILPDTGHTARVTRLQFSGDGGLLLSTGADNTAHLWDVSSEAHVTRLEGGVSGGISGPGDTVALASMLGSVAIYDVTRPSESKQLRQFPRAAGVVLSPDSSFVASIGLERPAPIRLFGVSTGMEFRSIQTGNARLHFIRLSADAKRIAAVSTDGRIQVWDIRTGREELNQAPGAWSLLEFSPDSQSIAIQAPLSTARGRTPIQILDIATGNPVQSLDEPPRTRAAAFHPDGRRLLVAGSDDQLRLWDLPTGELLRMVEGPRSAASAATVVPGGELFVTGSEDGQILLWDLKILTDQ